MNMTNTGTKVTIYSKGILGSIVKHEGTLREFDEHGVRFMARGARSRTSYIQSFYSSFWCIAEGWNLPDPATAWNPAETDGTVTTRNGRARSCDPMWVAEFLAGAGSNLKTVATYSDKTLTIS